MTNQTKSTILKTLLEAVDSASINYTTWLKDDNETEADYWKSQLKDARAALTEFSDAMRDDDTFQLYNQAEQVLAALRRCMYAPGANITITVTRDGEELSAVASLFDHAALVDGLINTLEYFQSEL